MILSPMRFKGNIWQYNPQTIRLLSHKEIVENKIPYSDSILHNFGRIARIVKGEGCIYGDDCFARFDSMWKLYLKNTSGVLSVPEFVTMKAVFSSLEIVGEATDKLIGYTFTFIEDMDTENEIPVVETHRAIKGQSLWDVGNIYEIAVENLLKLNPDIKHPFDIKEGDEIRLC